MTRPSPSTISHFLNVLPSLEDSASISTTLPIAATPEGVIASTIVYAFVAANTAVTVTSVSGIVKEVFLLFILVNVT